MVCDMLHCLAWIHNRAHRCALIYLIIIGGCVELYSVQRGGGIWYTLEGVRARVRAPVRRRRYYSRLCRSVICGGGMGAIAGNAPVKPCALFCGVGDINCMDGKKRAGNACVWLYCSRTKQKPCTLSRCKEKKPRHVGGVEVLYYYSVYILIMLSAICKPSITCCSY